jgi:hypothetical protein
LSAYKRLGTYAASICLSRVCMGSKGQQTIGFMQEQAFGKAEEMTDVDVADIALLSGAKAAAVKWSFS